MPAKQRTITRQFTPEVQSRWTNLLVSGCSYTWNNHEEYAATWPYYLRDLAQFDSVFDCSQAGSGYNHTHTAVITELETNHLITPESTLIIVMWSGNQRVDVTADSELAKSWSNMETSDLGFGLSTVSLFHQRPNWLSLLHKVPNLAVEQLREQYHRTIASEGQVLESAAKLFSLAGYLDSRGFDYVFLDWDDTRTNERITGMDPWARGFFAPIETLGAWAARRQQLIPNDGHPTPDAHLSWTREQLIPYLAKNNYVDVCPA